MENVLLNYGVLGVVVLALAKYIHFLHKEWKEDRMYERQAREKVAQDFAQVTKENTEVTNQVIREHTNVIVELKTLLQTLKQ